MTHLTGDFGQAVKLSSEVLAVLGRIYPSTAANVALRATLSDGTTVLGETKISRSKARIDRIELNPPRPKPLPEALKAIAEADLITFGPGSLFTSVIPNLLVSGIPKAIAQSKACKAYFVNLMSQPGETINFRASDHVTAMQRHAGKAYSRSLVDVCVVNTRAPGGKVLDKYQAQAARPVENDVANLERMGIRVIGADLLRMSRFQQPEKIRHDQGVLGAVAVHLAQQAARCETLKLKSNISVVILAAGLRNPGCGRSKRKCCIAPAGWRDCGARG